MRAHMSATGTQGTDPNATRTEASTSADIVRQIAVVVAYVSVIVVNALAVLLPINGKSTGELSDQYEIYITPAGYVFSIWSLIYLGLLAYTIFQALPSQRSNPQLRTIGWPFVVSSVANVGWILVWHYELVPLSLFLMLALIGSLITIYVRLYPYYDESSVVERWTTHVPFRIYLGWITIATIVNVTVLLYYLGWNGGPIAPETWTAIMLGVATALGLYFTLLKRDVVYALVFVWALWGIAAKHGGVAVVYWAATAAAAVVLLAALAVTVSGLFRRAG